MSVKIDDLLRVAAGHGASDLHLKVGAFPVMRIAGELHPIADAPRLKQEDTLDITPIRSVDRITVGEGGRGPITEKIQKAFFEITKGERKAPGNWLTYVNAAKGSQPGNNGSQPETATDVSVSNQPAEPVMKFQAAANATD